MTPKEMIEKEIGQKVKRGDYKKCDFYLISHEKPKWEEFENFTWTYEKPFVSFRVKNKYLLKWLEEFAKG